MSSSDDALILRRFFVHAGAVARHSVDECYKSATGASIRGILQSAMEVLSREDAHAAIDAVISSQTEAYRLWLLGALSATVTPDAAASPLRMLRAADQARELVAELADLCDASAPEGIGAAFRRMEIALSLGQADDHVMLARYLAHRVAAREHRVDGRSSHALREQNAA